MLVEEKFKLNTPIQDIGISRGGNFSMEAEVNLKEISNDEVEFSYRMVINVVGRFATFGERIMRAKAKELGLKFMQNVLEKIKTQTDQANKIAITE